MLTSPPRPCWIEEAQALALQIEQQAVETPDGGLMWLHTASGKPIGPHLYSGSTGIAFFLAALEEVSARPGRYRALSLAALDEVRRQLSRLVRDAESTVKVRFRLGGMVGLGGYIYALTRIGAWLGVPALIEEARDLTILLSPETIASESFLDVTHGSAGAVLALLVLHRFAPGPNARGETPLDLALASGRHLLTRRSPEEAGTCAWLSANGGPALSGFAHGTAGIAYALMCLYRETAHEEFRSVALEGLAYEAAHYDPGRKNWRDLRHPDRETYMMGWCSGAPGIALARSGLLSLADTARIRAELHNALAGILSVPLSRRDHLCCGNMSRVEALIESAQALGDERLKDAADQLAMAVLERARRGDGKLGLFNSQNLPCFDPSLLCGASGIGFSLLRLESAFRLPCLVLLQ